MGGGILHGELPRMIGPDQKERRRLIQSRFQNPCNRLTCLIGRNLRILPTSPKVNKTDLILVSVSSLDGGQVLNVQLDAMPPDRRGLQFRFRFHEARSDQTFFAEQIVHFPLSDVEIRLMEHLSDSQGSLFGMLRA